MTKNNRIMAILWIIVLMLTMSLSDDALARGGRRGGGGYSGSSSSYGSGKTVHVNAYTRRDGTYVRSHYRSPPGHSGSSGYSRHSGGYSSGYSSYSSGYSSGSSGYSGSEPALTPAGLPPGFEAASLKPTATASTGALFPVSATVPNGPTQTTINECKGNGWCYVTVNPNGTQEARTSPTMDISYPPLGMNIQFVDAKQPQRGIEISEAEWQRRQALPRLMIQDNVP